MSSRTHRSLTFCTGHPCRNLQICGLRRVAKKNAKTFLRRGYCFFGVYEIPEKKVNAQFDGIDERGELLA